MFVKVVVTFLGIKLVLGQTCETIVPRNINQDCCPVEQFVTSFQIGCIISLLQDLLVTNPGNPGPCNVECELAAIGALRSGVLDLTAVPVEWRPAYRLCYAVVQRFRPALGGCASLPFYLDQCAQYQMLLTCPINMTAECCSMRAMAFKCRNYFINSFVPQALY